MLPEVKDHVWIVQVCGWVSLLAMKEIWEFKRIVDEEDWNHVKSIIEGFDKYLPKMTVKQVQQE